MQNPDHSRHAGNVAGMFGRIAGWYDFLNHFLSLGQDIYWRQRLVRTLRPGSTGRTLDLAAGTLDVSLEIKRQHPEMDVLSMDFSKPMLMKGKTKLKPGTHSGIQPVLADGRFLPLPDACVDNVTIAFGIRNIKPREDAYAEMLRVLAPGGRMCILEFGSGRTPIWKGLYNFYLNTVLPGIGRVFSGDRDAYSYLADTITGFPTPEELSRDIMASGFARVYHVPLLSGIVNIHVAQKSAAAITAPPKASKAPEEPGSGLLDRNPDAVAFALDAYSTATAPKPKKAATKKAAPAKKAATKTAAKKSAAETSTTAKAAKPAAKKKTTSGKTAATASKAAETPKKTATAMTTTAKKTAPKKAADTAEKTTKKPAEKPAKKASSSSKTAAKPAAKTAKAAQKDAEAAPKKAEKKAAAEKPQAKAEDAKTPAAKKAKKPATAAKKKTAETAKATEAAPETPKKAEQANAPAQTAPQKDTAATQPAPEKDVAKAPAKAVEAKTEATGQAEEQAAPKKATKKSATATARKKKKAASKKTAAKKKKKK
jgi:demethylmenaquinone methyltransferase/2-methoxy-6-polyprenyl-1,4-benzoquinol methylase